MGTKPCDLLVPGSYMTSAKRQVCGNVVNVKENFSREAFQKVLSIDYYTYYHDREHCSRYSIRQPRTHKLQVIHAALEQPENIPQKSWIIHVGQTVRSTTLPLPSCLLPQSIKEGVRMEELREIQCWPLEEAVAPPLLLPCPQGESLGYQRTQVQDRIFWSLPKLVPGQWNLILLVKIIATPVTSATYIRLAR